MKTYRIYTPDGQFICRVKCNSMRVALHSAVVWGYVAKGQAVAVKVS